MKENNYLEKLLKESSKDEKIEIVKWQFLEELLYFLAKIMLIMLVVYSYGRITSYIYQVTQFFELEGKFRIDDIQYYIISGFALIPLFNTLKTFPKLFYSRTIEIYANKDYIFYKQGFFTKKIEKIYLSNIDNLDFKVTMIGRLFNYGSLYLTNAGGTVSLLCIKNTEENYKKLQILIDKDR